MPEDNINDLNSDEFAETGRDRFSKYLELLDTKSEDAELWAEFEQEVRRECQKRRTLRRDSERWVQETLTAVLQYRAKIRNLLAYAIGVLDHLIRKAIREEKRARAETSKADNTVAADASAEKPLLADQDTDDDGLSAKLKACFSLVVSGMAPKVRELFFDYYVLDKHDRRARESLVSKHQLKTYNNLQVKIHRATKRVTELVMKCMDEGDWQLNTRDEREMRKLIRNYVREVLKS